MAKPIRVVQVIEAVIAGTQRHLLDLAGGLDSDRFEQFLVVSLARNPGFADQIPGLEARGVRVLEVPMRRSISPYRDWQALRALSEIITRLDPDLVHAHSAKGGFLSRIAARNAGVPAIYTPHILPFRKCRRGLKRWIYRSIERYAAGSTEFLIAVSDAERAAALEARLLRPEQIVVIPNGIVAAEFYHPERRQTVRDALGVDEAAKLVGAVGNLRPQKDYETLIRAAALVPASESLRFVIAGEGPLRRKLAALIRRRGLADRFVILGWYEDIPGLLAALDIFVMSSWCEGCPYALLEAMASGTPVVATAVPGIEEIVVDGRYSRLAPAGDAQALARAIQQAISDSEASRHMAAAARQLVEETYSVQTMLSRTAEVYERCVGGQ